MSVWIARGLGIAVAVFLGLFALDELGRVGEPGGLTALLVHLVPSIVAGATVVVGWRRPMAAAAVFAAAALAYGVMARDRPDWVVALSTPLAATALAFWWSSRRVRAD